MTHQISASSKNSEIRCQSDMASLIQITTLLNSSLEAADVRQRAIDAARLLVNCEASSLLFINKETGGLYFDTVIGSAGETVKTIQLDRGVGIAGWVAIKRKPLNIKDAQNDPRFFRHADAKSGFKTRNVLCVPVETRNSLIGVLQAINKNGAAFSQADEQLLVALASQIAVALENARLYDDLKDSLYSVVNVLAETIEKRDPYAAGHAKRVSRYAVSIAQVMNVSKAELANIKLSALLHDVGMISMSDEILQKKSSLSKTEHAKMMSHVKHGCEILEDVKHLKAILPGIKYHHESYDGLGPYRLKGKQIPLMARIIAVADGFDGLTHRRPYKSCVGLNAAINVIRQNSGKLYDPEVVEAFLLSKGLKLAKQLLN